jgi:hypothetical protein
MRRRWFHIAALTSCVFLAVTVILWLVTFVASPRLSLTRHFNLGVWSGFSGDTLGRLEVFNDAGYGPYRGSIIALSNDEHPPKSVWFWKVGENYGIEKNNTFNAKGAVQVTTTDADFPGIYYRHFQWPDQPEPLWTLMVSLWYPLFFFCVLPLAWLVRHWPLRRSAEKPK